MVAEGASGGVSVTGWKRSGDKGEKILWLRVDNQRVPVYHKADRSVSNDHPDRVCDQCGLYIADGDEINTHVLLR